jgi:hypothetical protein
MTLSTVVLIMGYCNWELEFSTVCVLFDQNKNDMHRFRLKELRQTQSTKD